MYEFDVWILSYLESFFENINIKIKKKKTNIHTLMNEKTFKYYEKT
jgi:hypothetical protein